MDCRSAHLPMPFPGQYVAFVHSPRLGPIAQALQEAFPERWGASLLPVTTAPRGGVKGTKGPQRAVVDVERIRATLTTQRATLSGAILFVIDIRHDEFQRLQEDFAFDFPVVEIVTTRAVGSVVETLRPHLEYFGILPSECPANVRQALDMFLERQSDVKTLAKAFASADAASDFTEPRLVLGSLEALYRYAVVWAGTKQRDHVRSRAQHVLKQNTRDALVELIKHPSFDVSDGAIQARKARTWQCPDTKKRYFGWHLKWSLAGPKTTAYHCRVHYCVDPAADLPPVLWIGHCGPHLD